MQETDSSKIPEDKYGVCIVTFVLITWPTKGGQLIYFLNELMNS